MEQGFIPDRGQSYMDRRHPYLHIATWVAGTPERSFWLGITTKQIMQPALKHALAAIIVVLSIAAPVAAGPLEDGVAAYERSDYATALRLLRPLADQGNEGRGLTR